MTLAKEKLLKQILEALREQGRALEGLVRLAGYHHRGHRDGPPTQEEEDIIRAWNRPVDMWQAEALMRLELQEKDSNRQAGIVIANRTRQQKANGDYQRYRKIAEELLSKNPNLSRHRLAQLVRAELKRQGQGAPSVRTIFTALKK
jgi:hypothetical protein